MRNIGIDYRDYYPFRHKQRDHPENKDISHAYTDQETRGRRARR